MSDQTHDDVLPDDTEPDMAPVRPRRGRKVFIGVLVALLIVVLALVAGGWWFANKLSSNIERIPNAFDIPSTDRPAPVGGDSLTFLLGGLDGAEKVDVYQPGAARTDTIMLAHLPEGRDHGYLISIPRDTYIDIPGHGQNKINAAYSFGGPSLFVQTIEQLTEVRVDHLVLIDWNGFEALTDALGGVSMTFDEPVQLADDGQLPAGKHVLNGEQALQYVRERKGLPGGDFDRVKRQQNYLRALMGELLNKGTLANPGKLNDIAGAVGEAARVDEGLSTLDMVKMGLSMRNLRENDMVFLTVPTQGTGTVGGQSIVNYDPARADQLWSAMRDNTMDDFLAANPDLITGEKVN